MVSGGNEVTWQVEQGAALGIVGNQVVVSQQWLAWQLARVAHFWGGPLRRKNVGQVVKR